MNLLPVFPLYYNGKTKFAPIFCSDLTEIILKVVKNNIKGELIECVGPEELTFKEILKILSSLLEKNRFMLPMPLFMAKMSATILQNFPKPLLTIDQLKLLKYDSIKTGKNKTNIDFEINCNSYFEKEVGKYCYMWKTGGEYSK